MSSRSNEPKATDAIPDTIIDPQNQKKYLKGRFIGKGGFAKCYELTDCLTNKVMAGKIVSKTLLTKAHQKEKMTQEISIHKSLKHKHVVSIFGFFEDPDNVYVLLELCCRRSLMELHKRRKIVTEPEARYFVLQIAEACQYLHENKIIHRDLKLGNLFLNDEMEVKIGDFGLATRVDYAGERKKTLCGTPNYIAPEILGKKGHSYEVDVWSLGCILYTLLVGKPPFETSNLRDTYARIRKNEYHIPSDRMSPQAKLFIEKLLQANPEARPSMTQIIGDDFFRCGFLPHGLPTSCLSTAPRMDLLKDHARRPLMPVNDAGNSQQAPQRQQQQQQMMDANSDGSRHMHINLHGGVDEKRKMNGDEAADHHLSELLVMLTMVMESKNINKPFVNEGLLPHGLPTSCLSTAPSMDLLKDHARRPLMPVNDAGNSQQAPQRQQQQQQMMDANSDGSRHMHINLHGGVDEKRKMNGDEAADHHLSELLVMLTMVMESKNINKPFVNEEEAEDPAAVPIFWVSKWVDYSEKYGLGYQLCDNSIGVLFNDSSRMLLTSNGDNMQYIEKDGSESLYSLQQFPDTLSKKVTLLKYFCNYMNEHLLKAGANMCPRDGEEMTRLPFLRTWFRTRSAIILHLSNGTLQINFFDDYTKLILCPLMGAVTYIDSKRSFRTFRLPSVAKHGCSSELAIRLHFALQIVKKLTDTKGRK